MNRKWVFDKKMALGFSNKKLRTHSQLGDFFKHARDRKEVTLADAELATKVRARYLAALECGRWDILPQKVYVRGFIIAYARYLNLDTEEAINLFEREAAFFYGHDQNRHLVLEKTIQELKILVTPKILAYSALGICVTAMVSYMVYQVIGFAGGPTLRVQSPEQNMITDKETIELAGVTDQDSFITVNDERVPVTSDGKFSLDLKLHRGVNVVKIEAINSAKKEKQEVYTIDYRPRTASIDEEAQATPNL